MQRRAYAMVLLIYSPDPAPLRGRRDIDPTLKGVMKGHHPKYSHVSYQMEGLDECFNNRWLNRVSLTWLSP